MYVCYRKPDVSGVFIQCAHVILYSKFTVFVVGDQCTLRDDIERSNLLTLDTIVYEVIYSIEAGKGANGDAFANTEWILYAFYS